VWFILDSVIQEVTEQDGRTTIEMFGPQRLQRTGPDTINDCVLGNGVGNHAAGMFQVRPHDMVVMVVYAICLIKEGVWDNINDIVGN
jgi:hypothetical protein